MCSRSRAVLLAPAAAAAAAAAGGRAADGQLQAGRYRTEQAEDRWLLLCKTDVV
jgi:hypothetical protein